LTGCSETGGDYEFCSSKREIDRVNGQIEKVWSCEERFVNFEIDKDLSYGIPSIHKKAGEFIRQKFNYTAQIESPYRCEHCKRRNVKVIRLKDFHPFFRRGNFCSNRYCCNIFYNNKPCLIYRKALFYGQQPE
jgi:hypothetical protein